MVSRRRKWLFAFPAICAGLGTWQVYRHQWKKSLIADMTEKLAEQPVSLMDTQITRIDRYENRRLNLRGTFLHNHEMLVGPRNKGGPGRPGYYLYTPMLIDNTKTIVLVNRGWIPRDYIRPESRLKINSFLAQPSGLVDLHCMIRNEKYYKPRTLARSLLPDSETQIMNGMPCWQWVDTESMIRDIRPTLPDDYKLMTDFFIEEVLDLTGESSGEEAQLKQEMLNWANEEKELRNAGESMPAVLASLKAIHTDPRIFTGKPVIAPPSINVPNKHLEYIYTWYSLSALLLVVIKLGRL